jgi:two-component system, NarL family, nitrate/nitrite sensor histidine kinase NarX
MDDRELLQARWVTFTALSLIVGFYLWVVARWNPWLSIALALLTSASLTAILEFWLRLSLRQAAGGQRFADTLFQLDQARIRTQSALSLQRKFLEARSEKEILDEIIQIGIESLCATGASFVPYDEWGQTLPALTQGKVPEAALQFWVKRLSLPETRQVCKNCQFYHSGPGCVLLPAEIAQPLHVRCFPLQSGGREVGVVNFYFDHEIKPEVEANDFFVESLAVAGVALESLRSRDQEIAALLYLQSETSTKSDLSILLDNLLENVQRALDVDFALLYVPGGIPQQINPTPQLFTRTKSDPGAAGSIPDQPFLEGIWKSVLTSGQSLSLENATLNKQEKWKVLLAVPLVWRGEEALGVLILGSNSTQAFAQRHQALLETLAGQAALLIQNARLMVQVEYQAVVDERARLAREIHDGLAQTLAFLKIQASQMQNYLARGEMERLTTSLQASYRTLSDAYIDARQAIDNLRRVPANSPHDWIKQVATDFEQSTGIKVEVSAFELSIEHPANVQAQLIRIVQEALSNVRKHASAHSVAILGRQDGASILIEVRDDGCGFTPESVDGNSHYGLVGMRERAESIGADFQITSQPGNGTVVSLRMPMPVKEEL